MDKAVLIGWLPCILPWILGQGYQNLINFLLCHSDTIYQFWLKAIIRFKRQHVETKYYNGQNLTFQCIYVSLVKIHPMVQEIGCGKG